ncbi:DEAD/DEAH box helicase family protein, partial [Mycoplasma leonicaptivi]|uniref:DEAD/DEAH box helicase family protein n=1 Tax=Mycoplasma leonicaptivi TaxID=36742 RepID=UPI00055FA138
MQLTKSQNKVVDLLVNQATSTLEGSSKNAVYFKAPTGSGKTFMMLNFIDKLISWSKYHQDIN